MAVDTTDLSLSLDLADAQETAALIERAWAIYQNDRGKHTLIDDYLNDKQPGPYIPTDSGDEYTLLAERSITNLLTIMRDTPAQSLFVEGYRETSLPSDLHAMVPGEKVSKDTPLYSIWQRNGLDAKQVPIVQEIVGIGSSFVGVRQPNTALPGQVPYEYPKAFTLSGMRTVALYEDPANDEWPIFVFTVDKEPKGGDKPGRARYWDNVGNYEKFDFNGQGQMVNSIEKMPHGFDRCPVVPFVCTRDTLGRTRGIIEGLIPLQDRLNQTIFDLMVAQTYASFRVRYATGMTPPPLMERIPILVGDIRHKLPPDHPMIEADANFIYGYRAVPVLDSDGNPVPAPVRADATRFLVAEDADTKFGDLAPTPLDGFIASAAMTITHMAIKGQLPPYYLLGTLANLSADALSVAESSLQRLISQLQHTIGESWERVMALFAQALGKDVDHSAEVMWRDMSPRSFASTVDGLVKLVEVGIVPRTAARDMVPGTTSGRIATWQAAEQVEAANPTDPRNQLAKAVASAQAATGARAAKVNDANITNRATAGQSQATGAAIAKAAA